MNTWLILILVALAIALISTFKYVYKTYNKFVYLRMNVERQASHVQVHLKKKYDLIPALAEVVKGYATHEKGTLEEVTKLRSQWGQQKNVSDKMKTATQIEGMLSRLLIVQERYPKLKADRNFQKIMGSIGWVEKELVTERKLYNRRVSDYNVEVEKFPSNVIAKMFGFQKREFFSKDE